MKVCVRVRPLSKKETASEAKNNIDVIDTNMMVFDPLVSSPKDTYYYRGKNYKEIGKRANKNLNFVFDRVFDIHDNNIAVYQETTKDLVDSLISGFNCSVFAYGATGSGKTHTMLGSLNDPGIIFYTTMDLYKKLEENGNKNYELNISYFEIYNEVLHDLLDPNSRQALTVLEDSNKGMIIKNLSSHTPQNADHLIEMMEYGNKNRKQHPTDANAESSRSHAIFQINLRLKKFNDSQEMTIQDSKMSLIDLAGSERATVAYKSGSSRTTNLCREGSNINKSLLSLGNCINALADPNGRNNYIPYRSSKLTFILRDSLGGNCQTLMIAAVSPSSTHYEETHNTLLYAERAKGVQLNVRKNNVTVNVQPRDYRAIIEQKDAELIKTKKIIAEQKLEIERLNSQANCLPNDPIVSSGEAIETLHMVKNTLDHLFDRRMEIRVNLLDCEHQIKLINLQLLYRSQDNDRISRLNNEVESDELKASTSAFSHFHHKKLHFVNKQTDLLKELDNVEEKISHFETELMEKFREDIVIRAYFDKNNCQLQAREVTLAEGHINSVLENLFLREESNEEVLTETFNLAHRSCCVLKAQGLLSTEMDNKLKDLVRKLEGKKEVKWRDDIVTPKVEKMSEKISLAKLHVFLNELESPRDKRSLESILDITPLIHKIKSN